MSTESKPDPQTVLDETREFWHTVAEESIKNSAKRLDETARQIIAVLSILEGLYFHAITYSDLRDQPLDLLSILAFTGPLIFWLFSLICAALVFFPRVDQLNLASSQAAKTVHEATVRRKFFFLLLALTWMIVGSVSLILALGIYLKG